MIRRFSVLMLIGFSFIALSPGASHAQSPQKAQKVKEQIAKYGTGRSAVVKVKLYNDTQYKGYISRTDADQFEVTDTSGATHAVNYADVRSIGGKHLSSGAKLAIGIGIGAGATLLILFAILAHLD